MHDGRRLAIAGLDPQAAELGLHPGLPIAEAQARIPDLQVIPGTPERDALDLRRLAQLCLRYAPHAAPSPPDGVLVDVTGCAHLYGGERRMLAALVGRFTALGLHARAALAGTVGAAHALARFGRIPDTGTLVIRPGTEAEAIAALPPEALRIEPELARSLRLLGFATIGALARLPRAPLARRFGDRLALRLGQAVGHEPEPIRPEPPVRPIAARLGFVEPLLTAEAFRTVIDRLLDDAASQLETAGLGARRLELAFERVDATLAVLRVATARPVRDPRHLARLFAERLETVDPGLGVEAMRLLVRSHEPLAPTQIGQLDPTSANHASANHAGAASEARVAPLVDTLVNRLGPSRVWRPVLVESDVPERSTARLAPLSPGQPGAPTPAWPGTLRRPVRLLDPPQPVDVMALLPDHPPASFTWRRIRHRVRHADGPERIAGEWWRSPNEVRALRDYFRVEDDQGQRFWLFRRGDGSDPDTGDMRWFVHGMF